MNDIDIFYQKHASILAFLGDTVFTTFVREHLINISNQKVGELNKRANKIVCASSQSKYYIKLKPFLNNLETDVANRARNLNTKNIAKNSNLEEYSNATSLEAVIGYLYMRKDFERLNDLYKIIMENEIW